MDEMWPKLVLTTGIEESCLWALLYEGVEAGGETPTLHHQPQIYQMILAYFI
jgi:hypothetical protein